MSSHPDADAFMRRYLRKPTDVTTRLVFADWLEEFGTPSNSAWARYIRAKAAADWCPAATPERAGLEEEAAGQAPRIRARLTIPVALFLGYPKSLLQLLPGPNITVRFGGYEIPPAVLGLMPESVARENLVIPLQMQNRTLLVASADPGNMDTVEKLAFILNKDIILVRTGVSDIQAAINDSFGQTATEVIDSLLVEFTDTSVSSWYTPPPDDSPVNQLVYFVIREAVRMGGQRIQFVPRPDRVSVLYRIRGTWVTRDELPRRLLSPLRERVAQLAGRGTALAQSPGGGEFRFDYHGTVYTVRVAIDSRAEGPVIDLDIADEIEITR